MSTTAITSLRAHMADWNDLSLEYQEAAIAVWFADGYLAACLFCQGA